MDTNGVFVVRYENTGNLAAENAKLTLYVDGNENATKEIGTLNFGASTLNFWNAKYNLTSLAAGEHQVYLAMTADNAETVSTTAKTVTFTKAAPVPAFSIAASAVTVPYNAESYSVVATLTETNNVAATNVKVELRKGIDNVLATQTVETLAANGEAQVTLTVAKELFETGEKTYNLYVNDTFLTTVAVTFEEAPVADVKDLAITEVLGTIKLGEDNNYVRVTVSNNGNVDITDAPVVLKSGENTLGEGTVSAAAGQTGFVQIAVSKEGLEAGTLDVTATVTVEGDATPADNAMTATLTVEAAPVPEATFSVTAENVTVAYGATSFDIKAVVKNTSEVDAQGLTVTLMKGIDVVETKTLDLLLAAGAETEVTFTVAATEEAPFVAGRTASYYVQVNNNQAQAEVTVSFEEAPVAPVVDINLVGITGLDKIDLEQESNTVMVTFNNNSNVEVENATITLTLNGTQVGEPQVIATGEVYKQFTLPTTGLEAGTQATLVATLNAANNKEGNTVEVSRTLPVISGAAPAPVLTMNSISGWEVDDAGVQTIHVTASVFNNGNADAEGVTVKVYKDFGTDLASNTVTVAQGEGAIVSLLFDYDIQAATTFHVAVYYNNVLATNVEDFTISVKKQVADMGIAKIADINATTEEDVKIAAVLKNNSAIDAADVKVGVYTQGEDYQYQLVGILQTVETVAAGETANVEFNLGKLAAGTYKYYVRIVNTDDNMDNNMQDVTVKVTEPIVPVVNVAMTAIQGLSNIDLAAETNTISVWVENTGNVDANAAIAVTLNGTALEGQTVEVKAGRNANASFTLPTEGLVAGEKATVVATVTVEGNTAETTSITREYDIVNSAVATEPVFEVAAANVTVPFGATSFEVKATVKNTSTIDATAFDVTLFRNTVIATQTVEALAAGAETEVTFTVAATEEAPFVAGRTAIYYVQAPKAQAEVTVTFEEEVVDPVYDLAITMIQGTLDLAYENGNVSVGVQNNGNQDMTDAVVKLTVGETVYEKTVSVKAGETGYAIFSVATEGLTAGELQVTAAVAVENDATPDDNTKTETITVKAIDPTEATFSVTAENVTVAYGATSFDIKAVVKNTSEVDAQGLTVTLMKGIDVVETKTLDLLLAAGAETEVTFTVAATEEAPFVAGQTATYYVQAANAQAEVTVTFGQAPVEQVVDLAVTAISGGLSVELENNYLTVFVENKGNVDATDAVVTLKAGETVLGTANVSPKAGSNAFCSIAVPATALQNENLEVTATVEIAGDADLTNNTLTKTFEIALPDPQVEITVADVMIERDVTSFIVPVKVKNLRDNYAAKNVKVMIYDDFKLIGQATLETLAAGAEETVNVEVTVDAPYTEETTLKAWATGYSEFQLVEFKVTIGVAGIHGITFNQNGNDKIYTIGGQQVERISKSGMYIINGRTVVVK